METSWMARENFVQKIRDVFYEDLSFIIYKLKIYKDKNKQYTFNKVCKSQILQTHASAYKISPHINQP